MKVSHQLVVTTATLHFPRVVFKQTLHLVKVSEGWLVWFNLEKYSQYLEAQYVDLNLTETTILLRYPLANVMLRTEVHFVHPATTSNLCLCNFTSINEWNASLKNMFPYEIHEFESCTHVSLM